jgi:hypothetical protein
MENQIQKLVDAIIDDYRRWTTRSWEANGYTMDRLQPEIDKFAANITVKAGSKYIRIDTENSVWGFINKGNDKFKVGDILKAAGYRAPALNRARGNIFESYSVAWTGPHYIAGYSAGGKRRDELNRGGSKIIKASS